MRAHARTGRPSGERIRCVGELLMRYSHQLQEHHLAVDEDPGNRCHDTDRKPSVEDLQVYSESHAGDVELDCSKH